MGEVKKLEHFGFLFCHIFQVILVTSWWETASIQSVMKWLKKRKKDLIYKIYINKKGHGFILVCTFAAFAA